MKINALLEELNVNFAEHKGNGVEVYSPIDNQMIGSLKSDNANTLDEKIAQSVDAFKVWRDVPAPKRGEFIRVLGEELRKAKKPLGELVTIECGKVYVEGLGEVQEMIDVCDFAVGLSRQIGGLTLPSERPEHVMHENWLPLGPVGVISAFNFPVAVWAWNFALAVVCGDSVIWKPSEKTPLTALACQAIVKKAAAQCGFDVPEHLSQVVIGYADIGEQLVGDKRIPLISATGSCAMGRKVGVQTADRFGNSLLELGGNNAVIVTPSADIDVALPSIVFGAVCTAGQRCTTTRRVFVHVDSYDEVCDRLKLAYQGLEHKVGDPLSKGTLIGPLIDAQAYDTMQDTLRMAKSEGAEVCGGERLEGQKYPAGYYVNPALVIAGKPLEITHKETFAPITYVMFYEVLEDAIEMNNAAAQGLSSAIFTNDIKEAEIFKQYSDTGICNVNIGTSGAEIGGAFGGEKETGGGRESGSDSWRAYMRRQTSTTYYGSTPPILAQGVKFDL